MTQRKPTTILNVNDHEQTRYMVSRFLRMAGFDVVEAANGEEALRLAMSGPALVVLDIKLPDMSGLEVCRLLKARTGASVFVLQTSATFVTSERKVAGLDSGADGYLAHPFEPAELIATVNSLLRLKFAEEGLRQRADDLLQADKRKDEFLAMLAHELRNPLSAITAALPQFESARRDDERFRALSTVVDRQSKHLARLIADLLDVSRLTRGRIDLRREPLDVRSILTESIQVTSPLFTTRKQRLEIKIADEPLPMSADPTRICQVFVNLLDNAAKYSEPNSDVCVTLTREERPETSYAVLRVKDCGIGMTEAFVPMVFDLFAQADESLERSRGGMGIGLTLVRQLVDLHRGHVYARSEGLGKGSEFEVWLPLDDTLTIPAEARARAAEPVKAPRSILIIEDNPDASDTLQSLLELNGHSVSVAHDGLTGVEMAVSGKHEIAIIDIGLPGLNGYEVATRIRDRKQQNMTLIALTGYGGPEEQKRALNAGFDRHLTKPVHPESLLKTLSELKPTATD